MDTHYMFPACPLLSQFFILNLVTTQSGRHPSVYSLCSLTSICITRGVFVSCSFNPITVTSISQNLDRARAV